MSRETFYKKQTCKPANKRNILIKNKKVKYKSAKQMQSSCVIIYFGQCAKVPTRQGDLIVVWSVR